MKYHANSKLWNSNVKLQVERKKLVDAADKMFSSKTNTPDREKIAEAAAARAKEETEKRKTRREKAERQKEEAKIAEQEEINKMKMKAAEKSEALERKYAIKSAEAKSYAAAAAEKRALQAEAMEFVFSRSETQEKEVTDSLSNNMESTPLNLINPVKTEKQLREMDGLQTPKETSEKESISSTLDNQQQKLGYNEELDHTNKSGVRPKEIIKRSLIPSHNQDKQEKEIVTVMGKTVSQSRDSGGQKETVLGARRENFIVNEQDEPVIYKSGKLSMDYEELEHKKKLKDKEIEENKQKYTQGNRNTRTSGNRGVKEPIREGERSCRNQQHTTSPTWRDGGLQHSHEQPYPKEQQSHIHDNEKRKERDHRYAPYINPPRVSAQQMSQSGSSSR